jgi:hypothetical protein
MRVQWTRSPRFTRARSPLTPWQFAGGMSQFLYTIWPIILVGSTSTS